jgi:tRNA (cmo5U34)-methyltransferase
MARAPRDIFDFDAEYGARYDRVIRQVVPGYESLFPLAMAALQSVIGHEGDVLVVGAGTGMELETFASGEPRWRLTGVEPSAQMRAQAEGRLARADLDERVTLHGGYAAELPPGPQWDAATLVCVLHFLPDDGAKLALLRDIAERLRPGGCLMIVDACGEPGTAEFDRTLHSWMRYIEAMGMSAEGRALYRSQLEGSIHWVSPERLEALLAEAGFARTQLVHRALVFNGWLAIR